MIARMWWLNDCGDMVATHIFVRCGGYMTVAMW
jgi:hypothetical protein